MIKAANTMLPIVREEEGATLLEFAFVAPVFFMMIFGALDIGYSVYIRSVAAGVLESSARAGSLEGATPSQITDGIRQKIYKIVPKSSRNAQDVLVTTKSYTDYSRIDSAEKISVDNNKDGVLDPGDCWIDEDGDGEFGTNEGLNSMGGADDSVYYSVDIKTKALFPLNAMLGLSDTRTLSVKTLVINQPFGRQSARPQICLPPETP
jgi:TadE-like protein